MTGEHSIIWRPQEDAGLEHLILAWNEIGIKADGIILLVLQGKSYRLNYRIETDTSWNVRSVSVELFFPEHRKLILKSDGSGNWTDGTARLPELDGCIDVDISLTPFTNTLPIRRLQLQNNQSAELKVVYIAAPELNVTSVPQRYTRLETDLYRYEGLSTGFVANLPVDELGLVVDYPNLWTRVFPK